MKTLLLTRPRQQSEAFLSDCEAIFGRQIPAVISPLIEITPVSFDVNLDRYESVIFTSANGVPPVAERLRGTSVATVGKKAATLAKAAGAKVRVLGRDTAEFLSNADQLQSPALHCRGVHTHGNLAKALTDMKRATDEVVVYDQVEQELSRRAVELLNSASAVVAPLFSPRTSLLLNAYATKADLHIIAISDNVAMPWRAAAQVTIVSEPNIDHMLNAVVDCL